MNMRGSDGLPCATMDEVQQESLCKLVALGNSVYSVNVGGQTVNVHNNIKDNVAKRIAAYMANQ